ncbi:stalk domain-containing protein [Fusibacter bizertensis]
MKKKSLIASLLSLIMFCTIFTVPVVAASNNSINIILNGKEVKFTSESGYPYVDENNRTMVPLKVTMETANFTVGYDSNAHTAIVHTLYHRIEVPIGTNKIYVDNQLIENDTNAVAKNGRTYLPIKAVLESAGYTVEWIGNTRTVNAYTYDEDEDEYVPYSTSNYEGLLEDLLKGNVVYINGQYYATPDYARERFTNIGVNYLGDDVNTAIYPFKSRFPDFDESQIEWIEGLLFDKILISDSQIEKFGVKGKPSEIPGYSYIYAFYEQGLTNTEIIYPVNEMTDEFMNAAESMGTFNGITMKKENGSLLFNYSDVKERNIYSR